jgi:CheY-like chemotaxis protein
VLLVEDDSDVAALTRDMLRDLGFTVTHAASAAAALGALADGRAIDYVFTDVMMPGGTSGLELARELRSRLPDLRIVLTTGYADAVANMRRGEFELILKPYGVDELYRALHLE